MKRPDWTTCTAEELWKYASAALEQAALVARRQSVDLAEVERWCKTEGDPNAFAELQRLL